MIHFPLLVSWVFCVENFEGLHDSCPPREQRANYEELIWTVGSYCATLIAHRGMKFYKSL